MSKFVQKLLGDPNKKIIAGLRQDAEKINALEPEIQKLSDDELKAKTQEFKDRLGAGETLDDIAFEAFAVVRETAIRVLGQRHFDVQLVGGLALHRSGISEMRTGEGKTLTSTLPVYLNGLSGAGVHLITVNDYLAQRDAVWMGQIFAFLGLSVGCIAHESGYIYDEKFTNEAEADKERDEAGAVEIKHEYLRPVSRQESYKADVTYGTNNEFGFDYLRDNMVMNREQMVQRELNYAIIDEVDSILIDEARTPLIISAAAEESADLYYKFAGLVSRLKETEDYNIDEKMRATSLTEEGMSKLEGWLGLDNIYVSGGTKTVHHIDQALKAMALFKLDRDYVVREGEVLIVDQFTGRIMEGRRYSEGLHQAIEAKEGVEIKRESQTLATITFQNYFRMYNKLAGMTGTAETEAEEFMKIYGLNTLVIPTNKPIQRNDIPDRVYKNELGKYQALIKEIKARNEKGQPVLVGTVSIDKNELVSELLKKAGVPHDVLNAKNHEGEAGVIAQAGRVGSVTVATNMAGRGVDIVLGGHPYNEEEAQKVRDLGGLFVIATERHESRRIDNQLRGRSGRQGDPGETLFCVSMDDDIMRIFGSDRVKGMMDRLKIPDDMPIETKIVANAIEKAQKKVEGHHFDVRKHLLEYDDVLNRQREAIYRRRREIIDAAADDDPETLKTIILNAFEEEIEEVVSFHTGEDVAELPPGVADPDMDRKEISEVLDTLLPLAVEDRDKLKELGNVNVKDKLKLAQAREGIINYSLDVAKREYDKIGEGFTEHKELIELEKSMMLRSSDTLWVEHLDAMTYLRTTIGLQGYGQRDPLVEYKKESFGMFTSLMATMRSELVYNFLKIAKQVVETKQAMELGKSLLDRRGVRMAGAAKTSDGRLSSTSDQKASGESSDGGEQVDKVGRNEPCPCGSGKKYKKCHGA